MKYNYYTIHDRIAEAGGTPFISRNDGTAARVYRDFIMRQENLDPKEFELLKIGAWDEETIRLTTLEIPQKVEVSMPPRPKEEKK